MRAESKLSPEGLPQLTAAKATNAPRGRPATLHGFHTLCVQHARRGPQSRHILCARCTPPSLQAHPEHRHGHSPVHSSSKQADAIGEIWREKQRASGTASLENPIQARTDQRRCFQQQSTATIDEAGEHSLSCARHLRSLRSVRAPKLTALLKPSSQIDDGACHNLVSLRKRSPLNAHVSRMHALKVTRHEFIGCWVRRANPQATRDASGAGVGARQQP